MSDGALQSAFELLRSQQTGTLRIDGDQFHVTFTPQTVEDTRDLLELFPRFRWESQVTADQTIMQVIDGPIVLQVVIPELEVWSYEVD